MTQTLPNDRSYLFAEEASDFRHPSDSQSRMASLTSYLPPFALLIVGLVLGELFGEESSVGVLGGGLFVWGFFWVIRIWSEEGEALRIVRARDKAERMEQLTEQVERARRS